MSLQFTQFSNGIFKLHHRGMIFQFNCTGEKNFFFFFFCTRCLSIPDKPKKCCGKNVILQIVPIILYWFGPYINLDNLK